MKILKTPRVLILRPPVLGMALGLLGATFVLLISLTAIASNRPSHTLILLFRALFAGYGLNATGVLLGVLWGFVFGGVFGFLIGWIYSVLVFGKLRRLAEPGLNYDVSQPVNVLQEGRGANPFTIVFVANPLLISRDGTTLLDDPILAQPNLFIKTVVRCLRSFANNELLRIPEVAEALRIVTIFDPSRRSRSPENALCEFFSEFDNILAPRANVDVITDYVRKTAGADSKIREIDIVYVISASPQYTRSTARFMEDEVDGLAFRFAFGTDPTALEEARHAFYARKPGVIALWAFDDRLKTPVHEFAHALSSLENGAVVDEYLDAYEPESESRLTRVINRKRTAVAADPTPDLFATYEGPAGQPMIYASDRHRSDKPPEWTSYVPERDHLSTSCIMDVAYFSYRYDRLLFDFLYDRLYAKINRPAR